jgi:hypothetical protein
VSISLSAWHAQGSTSIDIIAWELGGTSRLLDVLEDRADAPRPDALDEQRLTAARRGARILK